MGKIDFSVRLSKEDWKEDVGGWNCPAVGIPGAKVTSIYSEGEALSKDNYSVEPTFGVIRFHKTLKYGTRPNQVVVLIKLTKNLITRRTFWSVVFTVIPVITGILITVAQYIPIFGTPDTPQEFTLVHDTIFIPVSDDPSTEGEPLEQRTLSKQTEGKQCKMFGKVLDIQSKSPIGGVELAWNGTVMAKTDKNGRFAFELHNPYENRTTMKIILHKSGYESDFGLTYLCHPNPLLFKLKKTAVQR